ncbi:MAG TPA: SLBB domain-containing protein [Armatimonadota bacterium]|jgi:protein involved in polysaccharide export with SLBB domain
MRIRYIAVIFSLLITSLITFAQSPSPTYRLGAEDTISLVVLKHPEFSGDFLIPSDGVLDLPGVGKVTISGKTIDDVTGELVQRFSERLLRPEVTIVLRTPRIQRMYVLGAVRSPGIFDFKEGWHITQALAAAGGLSGPIEDCTVTLLRAATGKQLKISMSEAFAAKPDANLSLAPGDVLTIEQIELMPIYVMGAVKTPGMTDLRAGSGVAEALAKAGGLTIPAAEARITLQRNGKLVATIAPKQLTAVPMQRGDILTVDPLRATSVMVTGSVKTPGLFELKDGEGVVEAITLAGGASDKAALSHVKIVRSTGVMETVDMAQAFRSEKSIVNVKLASGDLIIVPEITSGVVVLGYVSAPGYYPLADGKRVLLSEVIALAKGPDLRRAGINKVAIQRTMNDGTQTRMIVDLEHFMKTGDAKSNPEIQPNDIVYVPQTRKPDWAAIFQATLSASSLLYTVNHL